MTKIYELWDHKCEGLEKLAKEHMLYFEGYACWCSPMERHYKMDWDDETYDVKYCPCCGESIKPIYFQHRQNLNLFPSFTFVSNK